jgi:uncharacterized repeat protein (TIGR03803 family)
MNIRKIESDRLNFRLKNQFIRLTALLFVSLGCFSVHAGLIFTTLHTFDGTNGADPLMVSGLVQDSDGTLYGTTTGYGHSPDTSSLGTVFKLESDNTFTTLVTFDGTNGSRPNSGPLICGDDYLYGTTSHGGSAADAGTIFKMDRTGNLTTLFVFNGTNGANPIGGLVRTSDGSFYGATDEGGATFDHSSPYNGYGSIFRFTTNGELTTLFSFNQTNGSFPYGLVKGPDGNFYGTTHAGGDLDLGTFFRITPDGTFTSLLSFNGTNGMIPEGLLLLAKDGSFYGATDFYNTNLYDPADTNYDNINFNGSVYRVTPDGILTTLSQFNGTNGRAPWIGLTEGPDGNLYGVTYWGGTYDMGTIYRVTPTGVFTSLLSFDGTNNDAIPFSPLTLGRDGCFYGSTSGSGAASYGTVFRVSIPMAPKLQSLTSSNGSVLLTWSSVASQTYQLQFNSDLNSTNWTNLGAATLATNSTMSASDAVGTNLLRFYRVVLLP